MVRHTVPLLNEESIVYNREAVEEEEHIGHDLPAWVGLVDDSLDYPIVVVANVDVRFV